MDEILKEIEGRGMALKDVRVYVNTKYGADYSYNSVWYWVRKKKKAPYGKPYPRDVRRPADAKDAIIGFCDESAFSSQPNHKRVVNTKVAYHKAGDFIRFSEVVRAENPDRPILLILDNARIHHAKIVKLMCLELDIRLVYLPPYSPDLNPIEFAWKDGKKSLAMQDFDSIKEKAEKTLVDIMNERKHGYAGKWMTAFIVPKGC